MHDNHPTNRSALPLPENVLLWSLRAWVIGHNRRIDVVQRIGAVFTQLGASEAASYLDDFMRILCRGATRTLNIDCVCYPEVSADESTLLDVFALQQEGYGNEARALLRQLIERNAAAAGCCSAARLVLALKAAGHALPRGEAAIRRHAFLHRATVNMLENSSTHLQ
jgi:hypothetical protein